MVDSKKMEKLMKKIAYTLFTLNVYLECAISALILPRADFLSFEVSLNDKQSCNNILSYWNNYIEQFKGIQCNTLNEMYLYEFKGYEEFIRLLNNGNVDKILLNHAAFKLWFEINSLLTHLNSDNMKIHDSRKMNDVSRNEILALKAAIENKNFSILSSKYLKWRDNTDNFLIPIIQVMALYQAIKGDCALLIWYVSHASSSDDEMLAGSLDGFLHRLVIACQINPKILSQVKPKLSIRSNYQRFNRDPQNKLGLLPMEYAIAAKNYDLIKLLKNINCGVYFVDKFEYLFIRMIIACGYDLNSLKNTLTAMGINIQKPTINKETQIDIAKKYNDTKYIEALNYLSGNISLINEKDWNNRFAIEAE